MMKLLRRNNLHQSVKYFSPQWSHVEMGPKDPILGVAENFQACKNAKKVNVGVGAQRDNEGKPWVLPSVKKAEEIIQQSGFNHEYAPISGVQSFVQKAIGLAQGKNLIEKMGPRISAMQVLSGTGGLKVAFDYISRWAINGNKPTVHLPNPTWGNHFPLAEHTGLKTAMQRYWEPKTLGVNIEGMLEDLNKIADNDVVLLHACAHNPTGCDLSNDEWMKLAEVCKRKNLLVLFDMAYQGFATGDTDRDAFAVRHFAEQGCNIMLTQSFAKNMGLQGQRVGALSVLCKDEDESKRVTSQLKIIARANYSNPPIHGARIVDTVLSDPNLEKAWRGEIKEMANRIVDMREKLKEELIKAGSTKNWDHITNQIGMFSFTGLTPAQCDVITDKYSIYLTRNGRISMAGLNTNNVAYVAEAIHDVTK